MSFQPRPIAPFKIDILPTSNPSTYTAGAKIPISGSTTNTSALVSSGEITVYSGSHWRLEYSAVFAGNASAQCQYEIRFYDTTAGSYIGQSLWGTTVNQNNARKGRVVCTALVLNSDISTSKTIKIEIISQTGMSDGAQYLYLGTPSFRIMELPV